MTLPTNVRRRHSHIRIRTVLLLSCTVRTSQRVVVVIIIVAHQMPANGMVVRIRSTVVAHRQSTAAAVEAVMMAATDDAVVHVVAHIVSTAVRWLKVADALGGNDVRVITGSQTHFHLPHRVLGVDTAAGVRMCIAGDWVAAVKPCDFVGSYI